MIYSKKKLAILAITILGVGAGVVAYQSFLKGARRGTSVDQNENGFDSIQVGTLPVTPRDEFAGPIAEWSNLVDRTPNSLAILAELEKTIPIRFSEETPLSDVVQYLREASKSVAFPEGLPIYVDPQGLQDADKTIASTVSINLVGIPLKTTLALLLRQISMVYHVEHGVLIITSATSDDDPSPIDRLLLMADRGELSKRQCGELRSMLLLRLELLKLKRTVTNITNDHEMMGAIGR